MNRMKFGRMISSYCAIFLSFILVNGFALSAFASEADAGYSLETAGVQYDMPGGEAEEETPANWWWLSHAFTYVQVEGEPYMVVGSEQELRFALNENYAMGKIFAYYEKLYGPVEDIEEWDFEAYYDLLDEYYYDAIDAYAGVVLGRDISLEAPVQFKEDIVVDGNGYTITAGQEVDWHFEASHLPLTPPYMQLQDTLPHAGIVLRNVTLKGPQEGYSGGIYVTSVLDMENVRLENTHGIFQEYDAFLYSAALYGVGCSFVNNAKQGLDEQRHSLYGGAIYIAPQHESDEGMVQLYLEDCTFSGNKAELGGAVYVGQVGEGSIALRDCMFDGNSAKYGGALYNKGVYSSFTMEGSLFRGNRAEVWGGAVYSGTGMLEIDSCRFMDNMASSQGSAVQGDGGALYIKMDGAEKGFTYPEVRILGNSRFEGNRAYGGEGGAIYMRGATAQQLERLLGEMDHHELQGVLNLVADMYYDEDDDLVKAETTIFEDNHAGLNGGAIMVQDARLLIEGTTISNYNEETEDWDCELREIEFRNNTAAGHGGAIYVVNDLYETEEDFPESIPAVGIAYALFENNDALYGAGVALNHVRFSYCCNFRRVGFVGNGNPETKGALYIAALPKPVYDSAACIINSRFIDNAGSDGAGLYIKEDAEDTVVLDGVLFENNTATGRGGAIFAGGTVNFSLRDGEVPQSILAGNRAELGGAIALMGNAGLEVGFWKALIDPEEEEYYWERDPRSVIFTGNTAVYGGAVFADAGWTGEARIGMEEDAGAAECYEDDYGWWIVFDGNTAEADGGAIWIDWRSDPLPAERLFASERVRFVDNSSIRGARTTQDTHLALHAAKVFAMVYSEGYEHAYNNHDIAYPNVFLRYEGNLPSGVVTGGAAPGQLWAVAGDSVAVEGNTGGLEAGHHTFLGWAASRDEAEAAYTGGEMLPLPQDTTLYGVWRANRYPVVYDANGGEGSHTVEEAYAQEHTVLGLADTGILREGYSFRGWNMVAEGTGQTCIPGEEIQVQGAITLYAQWAKDDSSSEASTSEPGSSSVESSSSEASTSKPGSSSVVSSSSEASTSRPGSSSVVPSSSEASTSESGSSSVVSSSSEASTSRPGSSSVVPSSSEASTSRPGSSSVVPSSSEASTSRPGSSSVVSSSSEASTSEPGSSSVESSSSEASTSESGSSSVVSSSSEASTSKPGSSLTSSSGKPGTSGPSTSEEGGVSVPEPEPQTSRTTSHPVIVTPSTSRASSGSPSSSEGGSSQPDSSSQPGSSSSGSSSSAAGGGSSSEGGDPSTSRGGLFSAGGGLGDKPTVQELIDETGSIDLFGNQTPLGSFAVHGGWSLVGLLLSVFSLLSAAVMFVRLLRNKKQEEPQQEYGEDGMPIMQYSEDGEEEERAPRYKTRRLRMLLATLSGVLPLLLFLILENLGSPMVLLTRWTPLIFVVTLLHFALVIIQMIRRRVDEEDLEDSTMA